MSDDKIPEECLEAVEVLVPFLYQKPKHRGRGRWVEDRKRTVWGLGVVVVVVRGVINCLQRGMDRK